MHINLQHSILDKEPISPQILPVKWKINGVWFCSSPVTTPCPKDKEPRILAPKLSSTLKNFRVELHFERLGWGSYGKEEEKKFVNVYKFPQRKKAAWNWFTTGTIRDPASPHVPIENIFSEATLEEMSEVMSSRWMGELRRYCGKVFSVLLDSQGVITVGCGLLAGFVNCIGAWHKHGLGKEMVKAFCKPIYNVVVFPMKTALRAIDDYDFQDDGTNNDDGEGGMYPALQ